MNPTVLNQTVKASAFCGCIAIFQEVTGKKLLWFIQRVKTSKSAVNVNMSARIIQLILSFFVTQTKHSETKINCL